MDPLAEMPAPPTPPLGRVFQFHPPWPDRRPTQPLSYPNALAELAVFYYDGSALLCPPGRPEQIFIPHAPFYFPQFLPAVAGRQSGDPLTLACSDGGVGESRVWSYLDGTRHLEVPSFPPASMQILENSRIDYENLSQGKIDGKLLFTIGNFVIMQPLLRNQNLLQ